MAWANDREAGEQAEGQYGRARTLQPANSCKTTTYQVFTKSVSCANTQPCDPFCDRQGAQEPRNGVITSTLSRLCPHVRRMDTLIHFGTFLESLWTFRLTGF